MKSTIQRTKTLLKCILRVVMSEILYTVAVVLARRMDVLSLEYANTENNGEEKLVFLEQASTHVPVDTVSEVVVQVLDSLIQFACRLAVIYRLNETAKNGDQSTIITITKICVYKLPNHYQYQYQPEITVTSTVNAPHKLSIQLY